MRQNAAQPARSLRRLKRTNRRGRSAMSKTHFGYQTVDEQDKAKKVAGVFHSVASNYDLMNDLMSGGLHRAWKAFTIAQANVRPGARVLDIAGGTGDLSMAFAKKAGPTGEVWHTDINESMLRVARCAACSSRAGACSCSNSPRSGSRSRKLTTCTRSRCCRGWARALHR